MYAHANVDPVQCPYNVSPDPVENLKDAFKVCK
jgi:hypothetical protein